MSKKKFRFVQSQKENDGNDFGPFAPEDDIEAQFAEFKVGGRRAHTRVLQGIGITTEQHGKLARKLRQLLSRERRRQNTKKTIASRTQRSRLE